MLSVMLSTHSFLTIITTAICILVTHAIELVKNLHSHNGAQCQYDRTSAAKFLQYSMLH